MSKTYENESSFNIKKLEKLKDKLEGIRFVQLAKPQQGEPTVPFLFCPCGNARADLFNRMLKDYMDIGERQRRIRKKLLVMVCKRCKMETEDRVLTMSIQNPEIVR